MRARRAALRGARAKITRAEGRGGATLLSNTTRRGASAAVAAAASRARAPVTVSHPPKVL